ncbi:sulfatase [Roseiconus nitratireducens]|uniref:Sulfatase n=1 Tax=Roseiconus nitratireducens TaxID=2605748 RepID=A0A5M6CXM0_9BACT|nr:sulfatase [Roseiconus nitratireducens]KAA5537999.1 sulfatase [Roseiconus nitratireducens]
MSLRPLFGLWAWRNLSLLVCLLWTSVASAAERPNILYIMSDDHAAHAISAYGGRLAEVAPTPNIDRLANEGALFTNAFCTNSICSPSRACVLTGQYDHINGAFDLSGRVPPGKQMLAIQMKEAGYQTAMIGKWHLKDEPADFDYYCVLPGQGKYHNPEFRIRGEKPWGKNTFQADGKHVTDAITDITIDWLKAGRDQSKPFFLMHHFKAPHDYFDNAPRYESYLRDTNIPEPETLWHRDPAFGSIATRGADDELLPHIGTSIGGRNPRRSYLGDLPKLYPDEFPEGFDPSNYTDEQNTRFAYNAYLKKFLRCVKGIDDNLGRLFAYLEQSGQLDNTLIIYTADQGFMLGEHDYQDKRWMYEQSQRMPFLARLPGVIEPGQRFDTIIENVDYGPTMLDFAGAEIPATVQGRSFRSLLESGAEPENWKQEAYYRYWMHMAHHDNPAHLGIRTKTHKLIFYYGCNYDGGYRTPPGWELYDLENDPMETRNVLDAPENRDLVVDLKQRLADLRDQVGDDGSHYPKCEAIVREFWDDDQQDREEAVALSHEFLRRRLAELEAGKTNVRTWAGE